MDPVRDQTSERTGEWHSCNQKGWSMVQDTPYRSYFIYIYINNMFICVQLIRSFPQHIHCNLQLRFLRNRHFDGNDMHYIQRPENAALGTPGPSAKRPLDSDASTMPRSRRVCCMHFWVKVSCGYSNKRSIFDGLCQPFMVIRGWTCFSSLGIVGLQEMAGIPLLPKTLTAADG